MYLYELLNKEQSKEEIQFQTGLGSLGSTKLYTMEGTRLSLVGTLTNYWQI